MAGATTGATAATGFAAGLGTFHWYDFTLTAYNCLRAGTRIFCDFDLTKQNAASVPAWTGGNPIQVVGATGRVFGAHSASFVDTDGSTFQTANVDTTTPRRWELEFDDVPASYSQVTLALGGDRIQNVPVTPIPDSQPANTLPQRATVAQGQQQVVNGQPQPGDGAAGKLQQMVTAGVVQATQPQTTTTTTTQKPVKASWWKQAQNAAQGAITATQHQ